MVQWVSMTDKDENVILLTMALGGNFAIVVVLDNCWFVSCAN